jgi:glucokinase
MQPSPAKKARLCQATLDLFVSILGSEAGNLALKMLATGGIYLGGGIPPCIRPALRGERFLTAFRSEGGMPTLLENVAVHVILNLKVARLGAAYHGLES